MRLAQSFSTSVPVLSTARLYGVQLAAPVSVVLLARSSLLHTVALPLPKSLMYRVPLGASTSLQVSMQ